MTTLKQTKVKACMTAATALFVTVLLAVPMPSDAGGTSNLFPSNESRIELA